MWSTTSKDLYKIHPLRFSASLPAKHTNTPKKTMQIFVIKLRIFLMLSQIDYYLFDCIMKILSMLSKIYRYSLLPHWLIDNSKISRGWYELDLAVCQMNMSFGKEARSNSKKSSWKHLPKRFNISVIMVFLTVYLSYVASIYVMYLCSIIFQGIRNENDLIKGSGAVRTL